MKLVFAGLTSSRIGFCNKFISYLSFLRTDMLSHSDMQRVPVHTPVLYFREVNGGMWVLSVDDEPSDMN